VQLGRRNYLVPVDAKVSEPTSSSHSVRSGRRDVDVGDDPEPDAIVILDCWQQPVPEVNDASRGWHPSMTNGSDRRLFDRPGAEALTVPAATATEVLTSRTSQRTIEQCSSALRSRVPDHQRPRRSWESRR